MFNPDDDTLYEPKNIFLWFLLAFQGGVLNIAGLLGVGRFVSHLTGFATLIGEQLSKENWFVAFGMFATPGFFIAGAMVSAYFIDRRRILHKAPQYSFIFVQMIFFLILTGALGSLGFFGEFGNHLDSLQNFYYLFIIAYVCGMQNAVISSASGAVIRTTHLTGPTTDMAIGIVRYWTKFPHSNRRETFATWCRFGIIMSFIFGSLIGAIFFNKFQFKAFLLPVLITSFVAYRLRQHSKKITQAL
jgi:uncharacterized membrane protein YoaK (UPF0700 family)